MSNFQHNVSCKVNSLCRLFTRVVSFDHHLPQEGNIEEGWQYIEVLDRELGSDEEKEVENGEDMEMMGDHDHDHDHRGPNLLSLSSLDHPTSVKIKYKVLSKAEVRQRLEYKMTKVCTVLLLPRNEAAILLQHFKWSVSRTNEEWLTCEEKIRKAVGLYVKPVVETPDDGTISCCICHGDFLRDFMYSVSCGHQSCHSCWEGYIREAINDGPRCLTLRCPRPSCDAAVDLYFVEKLLSLEDDKLKFEAHLLTTYTANRRKAKWCPAPDCNYAVFSSNGGEGDVTCRCSNCFCWSCLGEGHAPVDCSTITEWMSEKTRQSENWLLANTISCPQCKSKFDATSWSFSYVECDFCYSKFCSACGNNWLTDDSLGLWTHKCYPIADNVLRKSAKNFLERYNHYYEKWFNCKSSRENALSDLMVFQSLQLEPLCARLGLFPEQLDFLVEALQQIAESWRLLQWMHVYGYYLDKNEHAKRYFFEFMQGEARNLVERLNLYVEQHQDFLNFELPFQQFVDYRNKITVLTRVLKNYFDRLMEGVKGGLSEVICNPGFSPRFKTCREQGENSCSQKSPDVSESKPTSEAMRD